MERSQSVDVARFIAIAAIVVLHSQPFTVLATTGTGYKYLFVVLNQSARFAVPFFFVLAGYYWGMKIRGGTPVLDVSARALGRLAVAFVAWSAIYLLPLDARDPALLEPGQYLPLARARLAVLAQDPVTLAFEGTMVHLWFLPALGCAVLLAAALYRAGVLLPAAAIVLYLAGVAGGSYSATPVGFDPPGDFDTRDGPFFSLLPFVAGYCLSARAPTSGWIRTGALVLALGFAAHFAEIFMLLKLYGVRAVSHDYVLGTGLMGLGAAMMALSGHRRLQNAPLAAAGRLTLGVYAIHILILRLLAPHFWPRTNPLLELVLVAAVLALSLAACGLLSRIRYVRNLVV